jgi:hypothetical protein
LYTVFRYLDFPKSYTLCSGIYDEVNV